MSEKRITTESIVNDLRVIAKYPQNVNAPYICRLAAERLEELDNKCAEFAGILPACEGCSGKTAIGERTKDCVYEVDGAYCMDRARKNYFALKARAEKAEAEVDRLKKILELYALQYGTVSAKRVVTDARAVTEISGYRVEVVPDPDEGGFVISFPDLPGCMSSGDTIGEAVANAIDALDAWLSEE